MEIEVGGTQSEGAKRHGRPEHCEGSSTIPPLIEIARSDVTGGGSLDIGSIVGQIASGGVGGGVLMVIVGLIKQAMGGQKAA